MNEKLKSIGSGAIGLLIMMALVFVALSILKGTAAVGAWASPFLGYLVGLTTVVALPILILLAFIPSARALSASGLLIASFIYGLALWVWAFLYTLSTWGWFAVIIGFVLGGVGVVPIAMLSALFHSDWRVFGQILLGLVLTFGCRGISAVLAAKADERAAQLSQADV